MFKAFTGGLAVFACLSVAQCLLAQSPVSISLGDIRAQNASQTPAPGNLLGDSLTYSVGAGSLSKRPPALHQESAASPEQKIQDELNQLDAGISSQTISDAIQERTVDLAIAGKPDQIQREQTGIAALYGNYMLTAHIPGPVRENTIGYLQCKTWRSPNLGWQPLYFEDENVERYGYHHGLFQPALSGACFLRGVVFLPYRMGAQHPWDCDYGLGYYRPGDCNPPVGHALKISGKGLILQGVVAAGLATGL
jgi:hypothetical protein